MYNIFANYFDSTANKQTSPEICASKVYLSKNLKYFSTPNTVYLFAAIISACLVRTYIPPYVTT